MHNHVLPFSRVDDACGVFCTACPLFAALNFRARFEALPPQLTTHSDASIRLRRAPKG